MSRSKSLSLDFLASKPRAAAGVLQSLMPDQAALYLAEVPVRILAPVLADMETWPAARILDLLTLEQNAAIFGQLHYRSVAALLRLQEEQRRVALLEVLPSQLAKPLARSLAYQENTVGAWMDMSTPHFYAELSRWECIALLKKIGKPFGSSLIVISHSHHIVGVVSLDVLLISPDEKPLGQLMDPRVQPLPAEMSLEVARNTPDWHNHSVLPVRNANGNYLGTLSRMALRDALARNKATAVPELGDSVLAHLVRAMGATATGLLQFSSANSIQWHSEEEGQCRE
ncbi:MAG: hypothetical protein Q8L60_16055 [Gammaproteobacteria bacterium]|nr:hypothetical protein [Gammaproteobacteria bacterium]MDP2141523.1 hypothetical protein [Gammaproteobacteria bacterium]MDP2347452.1 hypothetical protein [Gammaproteobacteria bacterium]